MERRQFTREFKLEAVRRLRPSLQRKLGGLSYPGSRLIGSFPVLRPDIALSVARPLKVLGTMDIVSRAGRSTLAKQRDFRNPQWTPYEPLSRASNREAKTPASRSTCNNHDFCTPADDAR